MAAVSGELQTIRTVITPSSSQGTFLISVTTPSAQSSAQLHGVNQMRHMEREEGDRVFSSVHTNFCFPFPQYSWRALPPASFKKVQVQNVSLFVLKC